MPQDHPAAQHPVGAVDREARLVHHGLDGLLCHRKVVGGGAHLGREGGGDVFQVGQPDVDEALPAPDAVRRLVAAGVADDGQVQPGVPGQGQGGDDPGLPLPRGDQIDVVGPLCLQVQKDLGQPLHRDLLAKTLGADGVVLAVAALEGAPREKDGAAAPGAADAGLFPEMQGGPCHLEGAPRAAIAGAPGGPVSAAAPGAEGAAAGDDE